MSEETDKFDSKSLGNNENSEGKSRISEAAPPSLPRSEVEYYNSELIAFFVLSEIVSKASAISVRHSFSDFPLIRKIAASHSRSPKLFLLYCAPVLIASYAADSFFGVLALFRAVHIALIILKFSSFVATFETLFRHESVAIVHASLYFVTLSYLPIRWSLILQQLEGSSVANIRSFIVWTIVCRELGGVVYCVNTFLVESLKVDYHRAVLLFGAFYDILYLAVVLRTHSRGNLKLNFSLFCVDKTTLYLINAVYAKMSRAFKFKLFDFRHVFSQNTVNSGNRLAKFCLISLLCFPIWLLMQMIDILSGNDSLFMNCSFQKWPMECINSCYSAFIIAATEIILFVPLSRKGLKYGTNVLLIFAYLIVNFILIIAAVQSTNIDAFAIPFAVAGQSSIIVFSGFNTGTIVWQPPSEKIHLQPYSFRNFIGEVGSNVSLQFFNSREGFYSRTNFEFSAPVNYAYFVSSSGIRNLTEFTDRNWFVQHGLKTGQIRILTAFELEVDPVVRLVGKDEITVDLNRTVSSNIRIPSGSYLPKLTIKGKNFVLPRIVVEKNGRYFVIFHSILTPNYRLIRLLNRNDVACWTAYLIKSLLSPAYLTILLFILIVIYWSVPKTHYAFVYAIHTCTANLGKAIGHLAADSQTRNMFVYLYSLAFSSVFLIVTVYMILRKHIIQLPLLNERK